MAGQGGVLRAHLPRAGCEGQDLCQPVQADPPVRLAARLHLGTLRRTRHRPPVSASVPLALPAAPLRDSAAACVGSEIYECSGVATSSQDADGHWFLDTTKPGDSFSAAQIREQFANFDTSLLPSSGPWFTRGATSADEDCARAKRVAAWLHSAELQAEVGGDVMVMFMSAQPASFPQLPSPCLASVQERDGCALLTSCALGVAGMVGSLTCWSNRC